MKIHVDSKVKPRLIRHALPKIQRFYFEKHRKTPINHQNFHSRSFRYLKKSPIYHRYVKNNDKANKSCETTSKAIRINQASRKLNKSSSDLYSAFETSRKIPCGDSLTKNHYTIFVRVVVRLTKAFEIWS